jgi:hypothetical protein
MPSEDLQLQVERGYDILNYAVGAKKARERRGLRTASESEHGSPAL